jgi:hypothetical protein
MHVRSFSPHRLAPPRPGCGARSRALSLGALITLLLAGCALGPFRVGEKSTAPPTPTATAAQGRHTPVPGLLDPAPSDCPASAPLQTQEFPHFGGFSGPVTMHGGGPVWLAGFSYDQLRPTLHLDSRGYTPWPAVKLIWEVGPNVTQPVFVTATDLRTGASGYWFFQVIEEQAASELALDPQSPFATVADYHGPPETGWQEWGAGLLLFAAGCYALVARWPGGSWQTVVSAGR